MSGTVKISLREDRKCAECGNGWAAQSGICLKCVSKAMKPTSKMKSALGRALQARYREIFAKK
jgi:hypothetical protein